MSTRIRAFGALIYQQNDEGADGGQVGDDLLRVLRLPGARLSPILKFQMRRTILIFIVVDCNFLFQTTDEDAANTHKKYAQLSSSLRCMAHGAFSFARNMQKKCCSSLRKRHAGIFPLLEMKAALQCFHRQPRSLSGLRRQLSVDRQRRGETTQLRQEEMSPCIHSLHNGARRSA